ncbi:DNA-3-methyladenine glycosylase family protein [Peptostreptococcus faecalis]|uniref:DNA-3-methyladenine glycosylase family protein n=1 Tax=Peptostreptococcus faecalis TaxID=2045015 RepID=UPI000C7D20F1|nr:DNA glycosylase [Peptostreptococcus faecalis]
MIIEEVKNGIKLIDVDDFDPTHIFECGQCFRWIKEEDESYTGVAMGRVINVSKVEEGILIDNTNIEDFNNIWKKYFDLDRDYSSIKKDLAKRDENLNKAVDFGWGIRILNQDSWEMIISFIISSNNRIPMIQRAIENISSRYGSEIGEYRGKKHYAFPTPEQLSKASIEELRECKTGFRDKYIHSTTSDILDKKIDLGEFRKMDSDICHKELMKFKGVGAKVADCIALFGMEKYDSFPVDVWVKRVMQEFYDAEDMSLPKMRKYGKDLFGEDAGFAQQYLFYYVRENGIGR